MRRGKDVGNGGALPNGDKDCKSDKSTSGGRTLGIGHLDRSDGYDDEHYSWRQVAKACRVEPGGHK